jgi:hypothetical protein
MARKPKSDFVAQLPAMIPINSELNPIGFWDSMQDSGYKSQNEIEYPYRHHLVLKLAKSRLHQHCLYFFSLQFFVFGVS